MYTTNDKVEILDSTLHYYTFWRSSRTFYHARCGHGPVSNLIPYVPVVVKHL